MRVIPAAFVLLGFATFRAEAEAEDGVERSPAPPPSATTALVTPSTSATSSPATSPAATIAPAPKQTAGVTPTPPPTVTASAPPAEPSTPLAAKPPPYSLPWQLRPVTVASVVRSDTSVAFFDATDATSGETKAGTTASSMLLASYKLTPKLAPMVRLGFVYNDEPTIEGAVPSAAVVVNPLLGATYASTIGALKLAVFGAVTLPIGQGGGDSPDPAAAKAVSRGIPARSAMDNAMFATNFAALIGGFGVAYVRSGFTAQAEVTLLQLVKTRGPAMEDDARTNVTSGLHAGYFIVPQLSFGGELRYQRWLTDAAPVVKNADARETVTFAIGPRLHLKLEGKQWLRPGISYSRVLDAPWSKDAYQIVQVDIPFVF